MVSLSSWILSLPAGGRCIRSRDMKGFSRSSNRDLAAIPLVVSDRFSQRNVSDALNVILMHGSRKKGPETVKRRCG
jgi:hypothetical protein